MKVTLDLDRLRREGAITETEYEKLKGLAYQAVGSVAINILVAFGVVAVTAGAIALEPEPAIGMMLGGVLLALGIGLWFGAGRAWLLLANICVLVGALTFGAALVFLSEGSFTAFLALAALFGAAGAVVESGLLAAFAVVALSGAVGATSGYSHARYTLAISEPTLTIVIFALLALVTFLISRHLAPSRERVALIASRTALFLVNFGFWIGSLWGDRLSAFRAVADGDPDLIGRHAMIPSMVFVIGWALALVGAGAWAISTHRRFVVNLVAVFAAIHLYTQFFERLGANPGTLLLGGLLVLAFALGLWHFNRMLERRAEADGVRLR